MLFVTAGEESDHRLREGRWWLVPWWAKEMPKAAMFNARIETADTSGAFKDAFKSKRCLIPADCSKDPWHIHMPDHAPFSFAGIWAHNEKLGVTSCTIITAPAVEPVSQIHDRMPVILDPAAYDAWLDPERPAAEAKPLLGQHLDGALQFYRVDRQVNTFKTQGQGCIQPVNPL